jgi:ABC-2 type transport system permease protein
MSNIFLIAKAFWRSAWKNTATYALVTVVLVLVAYAGYSGWQRYTAQAEMQEHYQHEAREAWLANPDKHPHRMAHYGHFAFRPKSPLSFFDLGMESFFGNAIFLEAHVQNSSNFSEAGFSTGILRFGEISLASVIQIVLPLIIIFLGFASVAAERESGTLKLYFTQGVSWRELIIGKTMGSLSVAMTLLLPIIILTCVARAMMTGAIITGEELFRIALLFLSYTIYLAIFCAGTVLISAWSRTSKTALSALIGLWLVLVIILPRASQALGSMIYKTPSKARFEATVQDEIIKTGDSHNPDDPYYKAFKDSVLKANNTDSIQNLPFNYSGLAMKEGERITAEIHSRHLQRLKERFEKQNAFSRIISFVNPYMSVRNVSMALSGTDYASYSDFQQQAENYRYNMAQTMNTLQIELISNKSIVSTEQPATIEKKYWASIDDFHYQPVGIFTSLKYEMSSLGALMLWLIGIMTLISGLSKTLRVV